MPRTTNVFDDKRVTAEGMESLYRANDGIAPEGGPPLSQRKLSELYKDYIFFNPGLLLQGAFQDARTGLLSPDPIAAFGAWQQKARPVRMVFTRPVLSGLTRTRHPADSTKEYNWNHEVWRMRKEDGLNLIANLSRCQVVNRERGEVHLGCAYVTRIIDPLFLELAHDVAGKFPTIDIILLGIENSRGRFGWWIPDLGPSIHHPPRVELQAPPSPIYRKIKDAVLGRNPHPLESITRSDSSALQWAYDRTNLQTLVPTIPMFTIPNPRDEAEHTIAKTCEDIRSLTGHIEDSSR